jgi:uncharacterized protein (DUF362 family)
MLTPNRSKVFLIDAYDRAAAIRRLMSEFDLGIGGTTALKANYNSDDPFPASTHLETLQAVVQSIKARGASKKIVLGERSGMGDTSSILENLGVLNLARVLGFEAINLDDLEPDGWKEVQGDGLHWKNGFKIARTFTEADSIIQICCLKAHRFGGHFTMSLKNSVGMIARTTGGSSYDYMMELHSSPYQRLMIAEINAFYDVNAVIMDASKGFATGGPDAGKLIEPGLILLRGERTKHQLFERCSACSASF